MRAEAQVGAIGCLAGSCGDGGRRFGGEQGGRDQRPRWVTGSGDFSGNTHGFVWRDGQITNLGTLAAGSSYPNAINNRGQIVGHSRSKSHAWEPFLWARGRMHDLGAVPGIESGNAIAINEQGQAVGYSRCRATLWEKGRLRDLGPGWAFSINDRSQVIGFRPDQQTTCETVVSPSALNNRGQIVGWSENGKSKNGNTLIHAVLWQNGALTDLGTLGGDSSEAAAIDNHNQIVGWSTTEAGATHAVLWTLQPGD